MELYEVLLEEVTDEEEGMETGPMMVVANCAEDAVTQASASRVGVVYEGELEGEKYKDTVRTTRLLSVKPVSQVDLVQGLVLPEAE